MYMGKKNVKNSISKVLLWIVLVFCFYNLISTLIAGTVECQKSANNGNCIVADNGTVIYKTGVDTTTLDLSVGPTSTVNQTTLWISSVVDSAFRVIVPNDSIPHDSISYIRNTNPQLDVEINISSNRATYNSANATVITSLVKNLSLISDGKNGATGLDSAQLCGNAFSNGTLGVNAKNYWETGRASGANPTNCETGDISYADNSFSCPSGYTLNTKGPVDTVELDKVIFKRRCSAQINQQICIGRTADLKCNTNLVSNVCCNVTYREWTQLGDYYNQAPKGSACFPVTCNFVTLNDPNNRSGDQSTFFTRIFEKQFLSANSLPGDRSNLEKACISELSSHSPMKISWNVPFYNTELGKDDVHQSNSLVIPWENKNSFTIPVIDNIESFNGDDTTPSELRYYITGIGAALSADPRNIIKNCLGLNGSNPGKLSCDRVPGPPFDLQIGLIDKYGVKSNSLKIRIPEGRFGFHYPMHTEEITCPSAAFCPYGPSFEYYSETNDKSWVQLGAPQAGAYRGGFYHYIFTDLTSGEKTFRDLPRSLDASWLSGGYYARVCNGPTYLRGYICRSGWHELVPVKYYF